MAVLGPPGFLPPAVYLPAKAPDQHHDMEGVVKIASDVLLPSRELLAACLPPKHHADNITWKKWSRFPVMTC